MSTREQPVQLGFSEAEVSPFSQQGVVWHTSWARTTFSGREVMVTSWLTPKTGEELSAAEHSPGTGSGLAILASQLNESLLLPRNWDSYGGFPVQQRIARFAFALISEFVWERSMMPSVVPTSEGGLVLEWHRRGVDLTIEVPVEDLPTVFFRDQDGDETWELSLWAAIPRLDKALARVRRAGN